MKVVIATSRDWRPGMAGNISRRSGCQCVEINNREDFTGSKIAEINPDILFIPFWSHYIPPEIFEKYECIIFHMTDLPFGRGGSPLQNLIVRGLAETKITALRCTEELDSGPVYLKKPLPLLGRAQQIYENAAEIIEDMIVEIIQESPKPVPQQGEVVEFKRRTPEESNITDLSNLSEIYDFIRMLDADGYPHAFVETANTKIEFHHAQLKDDHIFAEVKIKVKEDE